MSRRSMASISRWSAAARSASSANPAAARSVTSLSVMRLVPPPGPHRRGRDPVRRQQPARSVAGTDARHPRQPHRDDLPGADDRLNPVFTVGDQITEAMRAHDRIASAAALRSRAIDAAAPGGHPRAGAPLRRISAPDVGRHAPARDDRHGAGVRTRSADRRRAHHRARRDHPGADPRPAARAAAADRHGDHADHPRSRRGRGNGRTRSR